MIKKLIIGVIQVIINVGSIIKKLIIGLITGLVLSGIAVINMDFEESHLLNEDQYLIETPEQVTDIPNGYEYRSKAMPISITFPHKPRIDEKVMAGVRVEDVKWANSSIDDAVTAFFACNFIESPNKNLGIFNEDEMRTFLDESAKLNTSYVIQNSVFIHGDRTAIYTVIEDCPVFSRKFDMQVYMIFINEGHLKLMLFYEHGNQDAEASIEDIYSTIKRIE